MDKEQENEIHDELDRLMVAAAGIETHMGPGRDPFVKELRRWVHAQLDTCAEEHKPAYKKLLRWVSKNTRPQ